MKASRARNRGLCHLGLLFLILLIVAIVIVVLLLATKPRSDRSTRPHIEEPRSAQPEPLRPRGGNLIGLS
jgi:hypothetical protein